MTRVRHLSPILIALILWGVTAALTPLSAAAQGSATITRLVISDAQTGALTVLDANDGKVLSTFGTPSANPNVVASSSGRWVFAVNTTANRVTVLDTGLRLEDHGDHADLVAGPPFVRGTVITGRRPIDFWAQDGRATVHNDDDGTLAVFDDERLEHTLDFTEIRGAGTGHNNAVVLGDSVLLSLALAGRITAYRLDGSTLTSFEGCPGTHGWTTRAGVAAAGCMDGVMLISGSGASLTARRVAEPAGSPETARVSTLTSHRDNPILAGNFGLGLAFIDPDAETLRVMALPANPVKFLFDERGEQLIVLTLDGMVHQVHPASGQIVASAAAVSPMRTGDGAPPTASMAVGPRSIYVTDPQTGELVELDLARLTVARRVTLGGQPRNIAIVSMTGVLD
jgi:hypothetical protein